MCTELSALPFLTESLRRLRWKACHEGRGGTRLDVSDETRHSMKTKIVNIGLLRGGFVESRRGPESGGCQDRLLGCEPAHSAIRRIFFS